MTQTQYDRVRMALNARQLSTASERRNRLIGLCRRFPKVELDKRNDHIAFRVYKRIFSYYLADHHGDGLIAFACKSTLSEQRRLVRDDPEEFFPPAYLGPRGWVAIRLDLPVVDWTTVEELAWQAYTQVAPKRLAALTDRS